MNKWYWDNINHSNGPGAWSWFHFIWLLILCALCFILIYFFARKREKKTDLLLTRIFSILFVVLEISKQIVIILYNGRFLFRYFPFDLCSIPIYTMIISSFIKDENNIVKKACDNLSIFVGIIGGASIMLYPSFVLKTPYVLKSLHSMLWHTLIFSYGLYLYISKEFYKKHSIKTVIPTLIVFLISTAIAEAINEIVYHGYLVPNKLLKIDEINNFFISPHYTTSYPILNIIQKNAPYAVFLICFVVFVSFIFIFMNYLMSSCYILINKIKKK